MARESYTSSTLGRNDPPHRGGVRPPSSPLHHEAKEQVQFLSTPKIGLYYGQLTPKEHKWGGVLFAPPILGPLASDPKSKKIGGCNFRNPHFGPHGVTSTFFAVLDS